MNWRNITIILFVLNLTSQAVTLWGAFFRRDHDAPQGIIITGNIFSPEPDLYTRDGWEVFVDNPEIPLVMRWGCVAPRFWDEAAGFYGPCEHSQQII